jgi:CRISPR-associated protein Csx10
MSELILTLRQPAQVGDRARSDFVLGTQNHIPGTVIRGALAVAWIAEHGPPINGSPGRDEFIGLFEGGVRFGPLFSGTEVVSLAVVGHKYDVTDCAIAEYDRALNDDVPARCPDCGSPFEQVKGMRGTVTVNRRTSVAIAPSDVAVRGQIVSRDTLGEGQEFSGTITADAPELLDRLARISSVRVGGRRTTHGMASVRIQDGRPAQTAQRRPDGKVIVRLRSPGIFVDDHGRPIPEPNPAELEEVLGSPATVLRRWTRWQTAGGWHIASGLPKPEELAVSAGSTFLISPERPVADHHLITLGQQGLGLRRHEGYGALAPPTERRPGKQARIEEERRQRRLMDEMAPLRGLAVREELWSARLRERFTGGELWRQLVGQLAAHAGGDQAASRILQGMAGGLATREPTVARALTRFLGLPAADAANVARELKSQ